MIVVPRNATYSAATALTMMNGSYIEGATNPVASQALGAIVKAPFLDTAGRIERFNRKYGRKVA